MAYEMIVGLQVTDQEAYARYREAMTPLLHAAGGRFRYDFDVRTRQNDAGHDINRLFVISFPDHESKEGFFSDAVYLAIRKQFFEPSVTGTTILAEYGV